MTNFDKFINHKFKFFDEEVFQIDATSNDDDGEFFIESENLTLTVSYENDMIKIRNQDSYEILIDEFEYNDNWEKRVFDVYKQF